MERQQAGQSANIVRPPIMEDLTATELSELEAQFDEGDREGFRWRAQSFGWTPDQAEQVWAWFEAGRRAERAAEGKNR